MKQEINLLIEQLQDAYAGDPWFGRNARELLGEVDETTALMKLAHQHSILELLWHMITWREFTLHCLQPAAGRSLKYFEALDWRELDHKNPTLWQEGLKRLEETQGELLSALKRTNDSILEQTVNERNYNYRKLITGLIQHDIYHLGQIAFIHKQIRHRNR